MKSEINGRKKTEKFMNLWKLNNTLLNQWIKEGSTRKLENVEVLQGVCAA